MGWVFFSASILIFKPWTVPFICFIIYVLDFFKGFIDFFHYLFFFSLISLRDFFLSSLRVTIIFIKLFSLCCFLLLHMYWDVQFLLFWTTGSLWYCISFYAVKFLHWCLPFSFSNWCKEVSVPLVVTIELIGIDIVYALWKLLFVQSMKAMSLFWGSLVLK